MTEWVTSTVCVYKITSIILTLMILQSFIHFAKFISTSQRSKQIKCFESTRKYLKHAISCTSTWCFQAIFVISDNNFIQESCLMFINFSDFNDLVKMFLAKTFAFIYFIFVFSSAQETRNLFSQQEVSFINFILG